MSPALAVAPPATDLPPGIDYASLADEQLLARFFREREDAAFAALVERHGPLVYGVCRRVLPDDNDAQDAFQATFLVLVRRGAALAQPARLPNWLFGVAYRAARKVRARAATRSKHEREACAMPAVAEVDAMTLHELRTILDEEIAALPEKYALPLVLCYLQGQTNSEAAARLGWPEGSMSRRLARARELLKSRLVRRGLALSAALVAALFARPLVASPPPGLVEATVSASCLLRRGVPLDEVVSGQAAAVATEVAASLTPPAKVAAWSLLALASLVLAAAVGVWQFGSPANAWGGDPANAHTCANPACAAPAAAAESPAANRACPPPAEP